MTKRFVALGLALSLSACATTPPPAAVLDYAGLDCRARPDLAAAIPLLPGKRRGETVRTAVDAATPCLQVNGGASPYLVYAMPAGAQLIDVGGVIEPARVFPPVIAVLSESGEVLRSFGPEQYLNRSDRYSVQFAPREGERYILVTANRDLVGSSYEAVTTGTTATYIGTGSWTSGVDRTVLRSRSYHGAVVATVFDPTR